jgi:hypothetical protein
VLQQITKDHFNNLLGKFTTAELESMVTKFPYFQQGQVLLAKKYEQENNHRLDEQLRLAALYTHDRELLFSLFNEKTESPLYKPPVMAEPVVNDETVFQEVMQAEEPVICKDEPIDATPEVLIKENVQGNSEVETSQDNIVMQEPTNHESEAQDVFIVSQPHTFEEWLNAFSQEEVVKKEESIATVPTEIAEPDKELEQLYIANLPLQELVEEETHYSKGLENFIEAQKLKHKPQSVKGTPKENELSPQLITETMAKVYVVQKKYVKAIQAYEILALKYPEKNDFFAARIIELKNNL